MHLLDTDTLTHLYAGHPRVTQRLRQLEDSEVGTTLITKIELERGRFDFVLKAANGAELLKAQAWLARTEELLRKSWLSLSMKRQRLNLIAYALRKDWARWDAQTC